MEKVRVDKWLWAVRIFKTRRIAADMCSKGKVTVGGQRARPSRTLSRGDIVAVKKDGLDRVYEVTGCIEKRVGAKAAAGHFRDLTPEEDIRRFRMVKAANRKVFVRPRGAGRPTKKERRQLDRLKAES